MAVLCGIDFSGASRRAMAVASYLAARWRTPLALAHVVDAPTGLDSPTAGRRLRDEVGEALEREAQSLRRGGLETSTHLLAGSPDEALLAFARTLRPSAVVIGAIGRCDGRPRALGTRADRIAQAATAPVLIVRDEGPFLEWARGRRPLRVLVGTDRTEASDCALAFARQLRRLAPVDLTVAHLYRALQQEQRYGFDRESLDADPRVERLLRDELAQEVGEFPGDGKLEVMVRLAEGNAAEPLVELGTSLGADLIIVGSHRRNVINRIWRGSISRQVLYAARCSVACVVGPAEERPVCPVPEIRQVLVATDFREAGNCGVRWAYALVRPGGTVHLVHVRTPLRGEAPRRDVFATPSTPDAQVQAQTALKRLEGLVDEADQTAEIHTAYSVLSSHDVAGAIVQAAERLAADVIVLGTAGRSALAHTVLGSIAQTVALRSPRPVVLVHAAAK